MRTVIQGYFGSSVERGIHRTVRAVDAALDGGGHERCYRQLAGACLAHLGDGGLALRHTQGERRVAGEVVGQHVTENDSGAVNLD